MGVPNVQKRTLRIFPLYFTIPRGKRPGALKMSIIDEYLRLREENRRIRAPNTLYTTDLTHPCPRQIWLNIMHDDPFPPETLRIFDAGRVLEDHWVGVLEKKKDIAVIATQLPARHFFKVDGEEWSIHGRVDILCQHDYDGLIVHEVKTTKNLYYIKRQGPRQEHIDQIQFYINALGVKHGQIDYLDKEAWLTGEREVDKSFPIEANDTIYSYLTLAAEQIAKDIKYANLPDPNPDAWGGRICDFCRYRKLCEEPKDINTKGDNKS